MNRRISILIAVIALLVGGVSACTLIRQSAPYTQVVNLVVPAQEIPAYTVITPDMVQERTFPKAMAQAAVYRSKDEVVGNLTMTRLVPEQLIYVHQLTSPQSFQLSSDAEMEVVSFPVKPEQAVGARVQVGQHVNIYQPAAQASAIGSDLVVSDVRDGKDGNLIVTVAAPSDVVRQIIQSGAKGQDSLWVTLAPKQANVTAQR